MQLHPCSVFIDSLFYSFWGMYVSSFLWYALPTLFLFSKQSLYLFSPLHVAESIQFSFLWSSYLHLPQSFIWWFPFLILPSLANQTSDLVGFLYSQWWDVWFLPPCSLPLINYLIYAEESNYLLLFYLFKAPPTCFFPKELSTVCSKIR